MSEDGSIYAIKRVKMFDVDPATRDTYLEEIKLLERLQKYDAVIRTFFPFASFAAVHFLMVN